jgi:hypothetical protein
VKLLSRNPPRGSSPRNSRRLVAFIMVDARGRLFAKMEVFMQTAKTITFNTKVVARFQFAREFLIANARQSHTRN